MKYSKLKPAKESLFDIYEKYISNPQACIEFFFKIKWPNGFYCEKCGCTHYYEITDRKVFACSKCGHQHYLLAGTIFQDNKLPLAKLIVAIYLFFTSNKGINAIELSNLIGVNYKTALKLNRKCRILMAMSNSEKVLDNLFYEADVAYIGAETPDHPGMSTDQQPVLFMLSTDRENEYPEYLKMCVLSVDNSANMDRFIPRKVKLSMDRTLNTDGKTTFQILSDRINVKSEKIVYTEDDHRLKWINIIIGNIKNNITGIYNGVPKRSLPLFLHEQEWRFNHRNSGKSIMEKVSKYIRNSFPLTDEIIIRILDISTPYFS